MEFYASNPGPIDGSVLYDQDKHVSSAVWEGQERGALRCHEHTSKLDQCPENASIQEIEHHTRAYLLYLVGSTIFSTTTGNKVPVMYLPLFDNFEQAGTYAWGAAALSFLYRALGNASLKSQSTISGCLTMLQCWSYYHLSVGRPKLHQDPRHGCFPFVLRWKGKQSGPMANRDVAFYRKALDILKPSDVEWHLYSNVNHMGVPDDIESNLILGRSNTMLICFDKAERHLPDRCLRQFGMQQPIPLDVQRWERKSRGVDGGVDLSGKMESELNEWADRHLRVVDVDDDVEESEYKEWYLKVTRKLVGRPIPISSEFQRMNAALRDIAHIADTLPTVGMDDQQLHAVTRIRYLTHECLRDHVQSMIVEVAGSQDEDEKKVRGKERVRRRGMGKRRHKDDLEQCHAAGGEIRSQLAVALIEVDRTSLCHVNTEVDHPLPCLPASDSDDAQLCFVPDKDDNMQLCDAEVGVDDSHLRHEVEEADESKQPFGANDSAQQPCHVAPEVLPLSSLETSPDVIQQNYYSVLHVNQYSRGGSLVQVDPNVETTLSLQNNRLTGNIPIGFGNLSHIYHLNLSRNLLAGVVPFSLSFLKRLGRNLDLSGNAGMCLNPSEEYDTRFGIQVCRSKTGPSIIKPLKKSEAPRGFTRPFSLFSAWGILVLHHIFL
ncbi:hypothetical protein RJ639_000145 [Escallonia herrerae]|uniref:Aminotransferase-like plant mobile domain-containing protein n=1 Tax=Escallonia herrerae TaxID=1293975 RepID=A0AA89BSL1_9ASTE|nr:hypothetical protein RJ639_000145 [Escallonia herrerae]